MLLELVEKRRSIRKFTDERVSDEDLKEILTIALHAPTAKNRNPVRYIVVRDKKRLNKLSDYKESGISSQEFLHRFFDLEKKFNVECVIGIGHPAEEKSDKIPFEYSENVFEDLHDKVK